MPMTVRQAVMGDVDGICSVEEEAFSHPRSRRAVERELANTSLASYYVLTDRDGHVAGYAGLWRVLDEGQIIDIAVNEAFRGRGYGEQLLRALMEKAWQDGCSHIFLEARVSNAAAAGLYRKVGYEVISVRKQYYSAPEEDAYVMECTKEQYQETDHSAKKDE